MARLWNISKEMIKNLRLMKKIQKIIKIDLLFDCQVPHCSYGYTAIVHLYIFLSI